MISMVVDHWWLLVPVACVFLWWCFTKVQARRLEAEQTGRTM
jgi:hypothetical protein